MEDHSKAVSYFEKAVKMAEKTGDENLNTCIKMIDDVMFVLSVLPRDGKL